MYSSITILFNPNSTGDAPEKARQLAKQLKGSLAEVPLRLIETEHAGHAEELAYKAAKKGREPLIVIASGDGGYNEVVNGVMRAVQEGATPVCAVHAAGNANDHRRATRRHPLIKSIVAHHVSPLDLLEVQWEDKKRYAHSYIGLGLTPSVAVELNRHTLSSFMEMFIVIKTFWRYQPFEIKRKDQILPLDSLVFANISNMAKVLSLSDDGKPTDGKFEIIKVPHKHKLSIVTWVLRSVTIGLGRQPQERTYNFTTVKPTPMQLDGEVMKVAANTKVHVTIAHNSLQTIR